MQATYTKEQDAKLIRLFKEGKKASEVAKAIGKTRNSVIGRKYRLKMCEKKERKLESSEPRFGVVKKVPCFPEEGLCKWPIGDVGAEDFYFCSNPIEQVGVYCDECRKKAYDGKSNSDKRLFRYLASRLSYSPYYVREPNKDESPARVL